MDISIKNKIDVTVKTSFNQLQSQVENNYFVFNYHVTILNKSNKTVQLLSRKWEITDSSGETKIVVGEGVVGEQPIIFPNLSYDYFSACVLQTGFGKMEGSYIFEDQESMEVFELLIPSFHFVLPWILN